MKILLIYPNKNRYLAPQPIGLAMIADAVAASHDLRFLDFMFEDHPESKAIQLIRAFQPDVIGLSLRNLDNQDSRNSHSPLTELKSFLGEVKRYSSAPVVLGGTAFTTFPSEILEFLGADYGIAGQGEKIFPQFISSLEEGNIKKDLPGLVYHKNGTIVVNPPLIEGYLTSFLPAQSYYNPRLYARAAYFPGIVVTKSGCPFQCLYCDAHVTMGNHFILRRPEIIVHEIEHQVRRWHLRAFHLTDPCFNTPLDYAKTILEAIIRSNLRIVINTTIRPDVVDEEFAGLMKRAGAVFLVVGVDTCSPTMLDRYQKGFTLDQVAQCCHLFQKHRIAYMVECVFGGPGETTQTIEESLSFLNQVKPSLTRLYAGFRILPETDLYRIAVEEGVVQSRADVLFPTYYFSKTIEKEWLYRRIEQYNRRYGYRNIRMGMMALRKQAHLWFGGGT